MKMPELLEATLDALNREIGKNPISPEAIRVLVEVIGILRQI